MDDTKNSGIQRVLQQQLDENFFPTKFISSFQLVISLLTAVILNLDEELPTTNCSSVEFFREVWVKMDILRRNLDIVTFAINTTSSSTSDITILEIIIFLGNTRQLRTRVGFIVPEKDSFQFRTVRSSFVVSLY